MSFEVEKPILNSPYEEPASYWYIREGETPEQRDGRRPAMVFQSRDQTTQWDISDGTLALLKGYERAYELVLVNRIRDRVAKWRRQGYPGATRTSVELLRWWRRPDRDERKRLFFAQLEAAETIIFLTEARADFRQGLAVPRDEPGEQKTADGSTSFQRYACKMATGAGKTTVMGMLAAWSILNKINDRTDARFSDAVLIVCPNVTIRDRLRELYPAAGEASLYRTRDLVPPDFMPLLNRGRVFVTNWHVFEPLAAQVAGVSAKVTRVGVPVDTHETVHFADKRTVARDTRYVTKEECQAQVDAGNWFLKEWLIDGDSGELKGAKIFSRRWVESDTALLRRALGGEIGAKKNILVMNDEAHHAYRIRPDGNDEDSGFTDDVEDEDEVAKEATIWVDGLDRIHKHRGINVCIDLSATPYFLARVGRDTAKPFPWTVSDFGLIDAIESGLVKIPQLAIQDTTGSDRAEYFNIWRWILEKRLTATERGGKRGSPKPDAILKYASQPISMLAGQWKETYMQWRESREDPRPPVLILVCKNTKIAKVVYEWIGDGIAPVGIPAFGIEELHNRNDQLNTIRVDSKVISETDNIEGARSDEAQWMRFTLDTVGRVTWPRDTQGRALYPTGFEELATKLERSLTPPGRDIRCIVSVGMLTEGWDANTVTHIIGLRPFMSQLLCEQVVGRGLRRASYDVGEDGLFTEEIAQVFGVPFEVIPFKSAGHAPPPKPKRFHVHALPARAHLEIRFPRVEGYTQALHNRIRVDWRSIASISLEPGRIPTEVSTKGLSVDTAGKPSFSGPGQVREITLAPYRADTRVQQGVFDLARSLTQTLTQAGRSTIPPHILFPQLLIIVTRFVAEKVAVPPTSDVRDVFMAPYYEWAQERILHAIQADTSIDETPEVPRYEGLRESGSTSDVDFWTSRDVRPVNKSHVNYMVADTKQWEQAAAFAIDRHPRTAAFVKNAGLGFAIPYMHDGQDHDYVPDFIIRLTDEGEHYLILETKGFDPLVEVKQAAAERWVRAVTADGRFGSWTYQVARRITDVRDILDLCEVDDGTTGILRPGMTSPPSWA